MPLVRRAALVPLAAAVLLLGGLPSVAAEEVPDVPSQALPAAGTCAPIDSTAATVLVAGSPTWYRIVGEPGSISIQDVPQRIAKRAGADPARHSVWVVAAADRPASVVANLLRALATTGIYRVGVQVRSEAGDGVMGFPLFLRASGPAAAPAPGATTARRLPVRVERGARSPSDPRLLYEAARRASDKFSPVVAEVTIHLSVPLQDAITSLDMLYRGGCAAVHVAWTGLQPYWRGPPGLRLQVTDRLVGPDGSGVEIPPIRPRKQPWGDEGANAPGSDLWTLEDIAGPGSAKAPETGEEPFPSYAAEAEGVPDARMRSAGEALTGWARAVAADLAAALKGKPLSKGRLVVRHGLDAAKAEAAVAPARRTFAAAEGVHPSNLHADVHLFLGAKLVGKASLTIHLGGSAPSVVFARWTPLGPEEAAQDYTLPPLPVDPYAHRVPGHLRVWIEGLLSAARRDGIAGVPLAPEGEVLSLLPDVAHAGLKAQLSSREQDAEALAARLRGADYDRVVLLGADASAAVISGGRVVGILLLGLESEERELRINAIRPKAAPSR